MTAVSNITESDCRSVISKKLSTDNFTILKYEQNPADEILVSLCEHSKLKIEVEHGGSHSTFNFFVKSVPKVQSQKDLLQEINGVFKEKQFFTKYCTILKHNSIDILEGVLPICYLITEESFIFEDLRAKGYKTLSSRVSLNIDCIKAALSTLVKLHASGLILEEMKSFRLIDDFGGELKESFYLGTDSTDFAMNSCKDGLRALIDETHEEDAKLSKELFTMKALEGCDLQKIFTKPSTKFRNTICHADPWTKNFMFKFVEAGVECVAVDFQTYRYGPPAQDVMAFIHLVADRELRDQHIGEFLQFYYQELNTIMERFGFRDVVTREEFSQSCQYYKQFALTQTLTHFQEIILSEEIAGELLENSENVKSVLFESKYDFMKMVFERDPLFKQKHFEAIAELWEFYEKQNFYNY